MSNNKLKAKALSKISTLKFELKKWDAIVEKTSSDDLYLLKQRLINSLKELHSLTSEIEVDVVDLLMKK
jgi:hypothetical protein